MKLEDFAKLTTKQLSKMSVGDLRDLAKEQGKKLNKRLSNIRGNEDASKLAYNAVMESGGRFGVKRIKKGTENEKKDIILEIKRQQRFQRAKSSTVKGAIEVNRNIQKATGMTAEESAKKAGAKFEKEEKARLIAKNKKHKLTKAQAKRIKAERKKREQQAKKDYNKTVGDAWEVFHKWREEHPAVSYAKEGVKSEVIEYAVSRTVGDWAGAPLTKKESESILKSGFDANVKKQPEVPDAWTTVNKDMQLPFI